MVTSVLELVGTQQHLVADAELLSVSDEVCVLMRPQRG